MKFPQIGEMLPNGHIVDAAYCVGEDRYVLAHRDGAPEPYVVWSVDQDGDTRNGRYFTDPARAQRYFASRCYDWPESPTATEKAQPTEQAATCDQMTQDKIEKSLNTVCLNFTKRFHESMQKQHQQYRLEQRAAAQLTPDIQTAIKNVHSVRELELFTHFWWLTNKFLESDIQMKWTLRAMYQNFLEDKQII